MSDRKRGDSRGNQGVAGGNTGGNPSNVGQDDYSDMTELSDDELPF